MNKDNKQDWEFVEQILRKAGSLTLEKFGELQQFKNKEESGQIVTQVDVASEKLIIDAIKTNYPQDSIIAEESGFQQKESEYTWIIDPLDGTSNYAVGIPWFGIIVARVKNWKPVAAGIYLPTTDEIYTAFKGQGAYKNGKEFKVASVSNLSSQLVSYSLDGYKDLTKTDFEVKIIKELVPKVRNIRATNSVMDFMYAADGRFGAAINQGTRIWDIAGPILIAQEAGCMVSDIDGNEINLDINDDLSKNFSIIISNPSLYQSLLQIIKQASIEK